MDDFDDQIKQTTKNPWYAVRTFNCQVWGTERNVY